MAYDVDGNENKNSPYKTPKMMDSLLTAKSIIESIHQEIRERMKHDTAEIANAVTKNLLADPAFFEKLAQQIMALSRVAKVTKPVDIIGVENRYVESDTAINEQSQLDQQIYTRAAFFPFEDWTHRFEIKTGLNEEKSLVITGGTVLFEDIREELNEQSAQGKSLLTALNASMLSLIETGKEEIGAFTDGRSAWFNMYQETYIERSI